MVLAFDSLHWLLRRGAINSIASVVGATGGICAASWKKKTTLARIKMREDVSVRGGRSATREAIWEM